MKTLYALLAALLIACAPEPKTPEAECLVDARAMAQIYSDVDYAWSAYRECLREAGLPDVPPKR